MTLLHDLLDGLRCFPDTNDSSEKPPTYSIWGFTIYRTEYDGPSQQKWEALLAQIRTQVVEAIERNREDGEKQDTVNQIIDLFRLYPCSDSSLLMGKSMDELRQAFLNKARDGLTGEGVTHQSFNTGPSPRSFRSNGHFLLADAEVLRSSMSWVKCVQADYVGAEYVPRNTRLDGQRYFGWMKMTTNCLLDLWEGLTLEDLESIAPQTIGGMHLVTWDGN